MLRTLTEYGRSLLARTKAVIEDKASERYEAIVANYNKDISSILSANYTSTERQNLVNKVFAEYYALMMDQEVKPYHLTINAINRWLEGAPIKSDLLKIIYNYIEGTAIAPEVLSLLNSVLKRENENECTIQGILTDNEKFELYKAKKIIIDNSSLDTILMAENKGYNSVEHAINEWLNGHTVNIDLLRSIYNDATQNNLSVIERELYKFLMKIDIVNGEAYDTRPERKHEAWTQTIEGSNFCLESAVAQRYMKF